MFTFYLAPLFGGKRFARGRNTGKIITARATKQLMEDLNDFADITTGRRQRTIARQALRQAVKPLQQAVVRLIRAEFQVRSGFLLEFAKDVTFSIRLVNLKSQEGVALVSVNLSGPAFYAKFLELGTKDIEARHFMAAAQDLSENQIRRRFISEWEKRVRKELVKAGLR